MLPTIFDRDLFDDMFDDLYAMRPMWDANSQLYGKHARNLMKSDIRETADAYELDIDLPGFKREEIELKLQNGYLTVQAAKGLDKDEKDDQGRYIRRERYTGSCSRSFYVGEQLKAEDIAAKFEDGILKIHLPKAAPRLPEQAGRIAIE